MQTPRINLSHEMLSNFDDAIRKEWIVTNGLGGYASSTILGINTRKYHGLLVAAFHPPRDRRICLEKLDEEVSIGNDTYQLGTNEFQNRIFPTGYAFLNQFSLSPFPKSIYALANVEIEKTVFMPYGKNATVVLYKVLNRSGYDVSVRVFPLVNFRHFHSVTDKGKLAKEPNQRDDRRETCISFDSSKSTLILGTIGGKYLAKEKWVERVYYREEASRGESCLDDWYQSGYFEYEAEVGRNESFAVVAVADEDADAARKIFAENPETLLEMGILFEKEKERLENLLAKFYGTHSNVQVNDWLSFMILAADALIVRAADDEHRSIIAGYHWFEDWGRDTFVSLPGLTLTTGRFEDARRILLTFQKHFKDGLIPNFIPDKGGLASYNSADATLWYVNAVLQYLKYTDDFGFVQTRLYETLKAIVENHARGTVSNIRLDSDGLLAHAPQLTWIDATVDGQPVNPRAGKAVEIQALWYNALRIISLLSKRFKEPSEAERYIVMAERARTSFGEKFWNRERNCLFDVVSENERDGSLRPNQIFAVALDFTMLDNVRNEQVVDSVLSELVTSFGLRSLAKSDPRYVGVYAGDRRSRDRAYHNGTVWPWLLGPFVTAFLKVKGYSVLRRDYVMKSILEPFFAKHVLGMKLGTASEICDGDPPHAPKGCILQAWSVAEPLRAYVEDVIYARPKYEKGLQSLG
jgi:predicted glycogen debranching enzyme